MSVANVLEVVKLEDLVDIRVSNVDKKRLPNEPTVKLCNYMDVYANDYIRAHNDFMIASASIAEIEKFKVEVGDVLITKDSETPFDIGIPSIVTDSIEGLVCGYHLALLKPDKSLIDSVYLAKQLGSNNTIAYYLKSASGSTRYGLSNGVIAKTPIPLLPLPSQKKIAKISTTIDQLIEKTQALIDKYIAIKQGMMVDLFTRGIDLISGQLRSSVEQAPYLYKETELGWIPKGWDVDLIDNVLERIIDYRGKTPEKTETGVPLITAKNIKIGFVESEPREYISSSSYDSWMTRGIPKLGDVLFTTEAPLANVAQIEIDAKVAFAQRVIILRCNDRMNNDFLKYSLMSNDARVRIFSKGSGSTVEGIKQSQFRKLSITFPVDIKEQSEINRMLNKLNYKINSECSYLDKVLKMKSALMQDLLTGKIMVS